MHGPDPSPDETASEPSALPLGVERHEPTTSSVPARTPGELADLVAAAARALGFARVGFCPVEPFSAAGEALSRWVAAGYHGNMGYLADPQRAEPKALMAGSRTLIVVALSYGAGERLPLRRKQPGEIARYARSHDYHEVLKVKLRKLAQACADLVGREVLARACIDTAPLLEREAARRAGLGFIAKNTLLILPGLGSYAFLGELCVDVEIAPSTPVEPRCGSCRACLDACPTAAFVAEGVLDARRCIAYLTIEHRGVIPRELRAAMGTRVFGCDVCQEVCPFNSGSGASQTAPELAPRPELGRIELHDLLNLGSAGYRKWVRHSPMRRANREQLARNAAVALGNLKHIESVPPLSKVLLEHMSPLVRLHAAWALGQIRDPRAETALEAALSDPEPAVRQEVADALAGLRTPAT